MAMTGPRLLQATFPNQLFSDLSGVQDTVTWIEEIDLSGLQAEHLTLFIDGVQVMHPTPLWADNVPNPHWIAETAVSAPSDPRQALRYMPGIDWVTESIVVSEDPDVLGVNLNTPNLNEVIYWRSVFYQNAGTLGPDAEASALAPISVGEGGGVAATARDRLYIMRNISVRSGQDWTTGNPTALSSIQGNIPQAIVTLLAQVADEDEMAYITRLARSYQRG